MGTDIHGWVEIRTSDRAAWSPTADVTDFIPTRRSLAFAVIFGARFDVDFPPLVPKRGLPPDVSLEVRELATPDEEPDKEGMQRGLQRGENWEAHSHTFAIWAELARLEWSDPKCYGWNDTSGVWKVVIRPTDWDKTEIYLKVGGRNVRTGNDITLRDAFSVFEMLFNQMKALAATYGADNVRVVVWFDS